MNGAMSLGVIRFSCRDDRIASFGEPIGAMTVGPSVNPPNTCAGLGAVNVTIASARAMAPVCAPLTSASAPDGMSTAITGNPAALMAAIASA